MNIQVINNQQVWDKFIISQDDYSFLHSWNWGVFNESLGSSIRRLGVLENSQIIGAMLLMYQNTRRGNFNFVPHGPISVNYESKKILIKEAVRLTESDKLSFLRVSPLEIETPETISQYQNSGFRPAPTLMHTEDTWILDIRPNEEELLREFRKTHRYLIKQAQKNNVKIILSRDSTDLKYLLKLQDITSQRHKFVPFSHDYLLKEWNSFIKNSQIFLAIGEHMGQVTSAAVIIVYGRQGFYFHSGSINSDVGINHLLQWEVIRELKRLGCTSYNFWGIAPPGSIHHKWQGITTFKTGFGGFHRKYLHAQDYPFSLKYWGTWLVEKIPRNLRYKISQ